LFIRILVIVLIVLSPYKLFSKNFDVVYKIDWNTLHIADLYWSAEIINSEYSIKNKISSTGLFNKLYPYELSSLTTGNMIDNSFLPKLFNYTSKTKKKIKKVDISFNNKGLINDFYISPKPDPHFMDNFEKIINDKYFTDPVSQLFQYFLFQTSNNRTIIDGRRIYDLKSINLKEKKIELISFTGEAKGIRITFPFYLSLWKNPKDDKNNLKYIDIYYSKINNNNIPVQIIIKTKTVKVFMNLISYNINGLIL
tara:strand:- start:1161 stop:1919 length:759 start_codon:yes stop_codon:yes gene_type:complete